MNKINIVKLIKTDTEQHEMCHARHAPELLKLGFRVFWWLRTVCGQAVLGKAKWWR